MAPAVMLEGVRWCDVLLSLLTEPVDRALLAANPGLRGVANCAVGFNNIDVRRGDRARHSREQHARRADGHDRRSHVGAPARRGAPDSGSAGVHEGGPLQTVGPESPARGGREPRRQRPPQGARRDRLRPHRRRGREARGGVRHGRDRVRPACAVADRGERHRAMGRARRAARAQRLRHAAPALDRRDASSHRTRTRSGA